MIVRFVSSLFLFPSRGGAEGCEFELDEAEYYDSHHGAEYGD